LGNAVPPAYYPPYNTYAVETPGGGLHLYFNGSGPCSQSKLGPKIDTRGVGGYVLVPPARGRGKPYKVVEQKGVLDLPEFVSTIIAGATHEPRTAPDDVEFDTPIAIGRARQIIERFIAKHGAIGKTEPGDDYALAARVLDEPVSVERGIEIAVERGVDPDWAREIFEHALEYRQNDAGCDGRTGAETFAVWTARHKVEVDAVLAEARRLGISTGDAMGNADTSTGSAEAFPHRPSGFSAAHNAVQAD
jgi:hypothetical protein